MFHLTQDSNVKPRLIPLNQRKLPSITIKQIQTAKPPQEKELLFIDGIGISQICLFAQIISINKKLTYTEFQVNDLTGSLLIKRWDRENEQKGNENDNDYLLINQWVKIYGKINHYNGVCSVNAFTIVPLIDFNELTTFGLEVIYQHLENTKKQETLEHKLNENSSKYNVKKESIVNESHIIMPPLLEIDELSGLKLIHKEILRIITDNSQNDTGCELNVIYQQMSNESQDDIKKVCDFLIDEGYVYSTIDDEHFKSSYC